MKKINKSDIKEKDNKKAGQKFQEFCSKYIMLVVAILIAIIGITSIFVTAYFDGNLANAVEKTSYGTDSVFISIMIVLIILSILYLFYKASKKISLKILVPVVLGIAFIAQFLWIYNVKYIPIADQASVLVGAEAFKTGDFSLLLQDGGYFSLYPFQTGMSFYIYLAKTIFHVQGNGHMLMEYLNVVFSTFNLFMMYLIIAKLWKDERIKRVRTIYAIWFFFVFCIL